MMAIQERKKKIEIISEISTIAVLPAPARVTNTVVWLSGGKTKVVHVPMDALETHAVLPVEPTVEAILKPRLASASSYVPIAQKKKKKKKREKNSQRGKRERLAREEEKKKKKKEKKKRKKD